MESICYLHVPASLLSEMQLRCLFKNIIDNGFESFLSRCTKTFGRSFVALRLKSKLWGLYPFNKVPEVPVLTSSGSKKSEPRISMYECRQSFTLTQNLSCFRFALHLLHKALLISPFM